MARVAKIANFGDMTFIETDYKLLNLRKALHGQFGAQPIVWRKCDNNGKPLSGSTNNYYILGGIKGKVAQFCEDLGNGGVKSALCGREFTAYSSENYIPGSNFTTVTKYVISSQRQGRSQALSTGGPVIVSEIPKLQAMGIISGEGAVRISIGTNAEDWRENLSKDELVAYARAYFSEANNPDSNKANDKTVWFSSRGSIDTKLLTIDDWVEKFPGYFDFDIEFKRQALESMNKGSEPYFFANGTDYKYKKELFGLWDQLAGSFATEDGIKNELRRRGWKDEDIRAARALRGETAYDGTNTGSNNTSNSGGNGSTGSSGSVSTTGRNVGPGVNSKLQPWLGPEGYAQGEIQTISIQRSQNLFLSADEAQGVFNQSTSKFPAGKPIMYQIYIDGVRPEGGNQQQTAIINPYVFDIAPNEMIYSGLGSDWVTIERTGGFPFIDWKNFKLLQIQFSFVIAAKNGPVTANGLDVPITDEIQLLRRMAQTPYPVMFYGFDSFLTNQFRYDEGGTPRGVQFIIQDLNISATRRNANMEITRAQATITLQEIPVERQTLIGMPRLTHSVNPPKTKPPTTPAEEYAEWTAGVGLGANFEIVINE